MMRNVCQDCGRREVGCHSWCDDYKAAREELDAANAIERKQREKNRTVEECRKESILRTMRGKKKEPKYAYK